MQQCWEPVTLVVGVVTLVGVAVVTIVAVLFGERNRCGDRSPQWTKLRADWLKANGWCVVCGAKATTVHHVAPVSQRPDLELDTKNLASVCDRCHLFVGHLCAWHSWNPVFFADAIWWRRKIEGRP